jgi:hypothetical protein
MSAAGEKRGLVESTSDAVDIGLLGPSAKKQRKKPVTAKSLGLTKEEFETIKAANVKKDLKAFVHKLNCQVDANWHDGYDKQAETKGEWFEALWHPLTAVLEIGVNKKTALAQCNEVLKTIADSYYDLLACPCRCSTTDDLEAMEKEIELSLPWGTELKIESGEQVDAWSYVWIALLRVHANIDGTDEALLFRCIKDAHDNMQGAKTMKFPDCLALYDQDDGEEHWTDGHDEGEHNTDGYGVPDGTKLSRLIIDRASEWKDLPTTKKVHRERRAIDRRFDGTPERRTRDYHLYDSDDSDEYGRGRGRRDCVIS